MANQTHNTSEVHKSRTWPSNNQEDLWAKHGRALAYEAGTTLYREGFPAVGLYRVERGLVKVSRGLSPQRRRLLRLVGPGELLGCESLLEEGTYQTRAKVVKDADLRLLLKEDMLELLPRHAAFTLQLLEALTRELKNHQQQLWELNTLKAPTRLARTLLRCAQRFSPSQAPPRSVGVTLSRPEWAQLIGVRPETVIRLLSELAHQGVLKLEGHDIWIADEAALRRLAQPPL